LVNWLAGFTPAPRTALVHGEAGAQEILARRLASELNIQPEIPPRGGKLLL
jgi:metallo-beta-lactamase family protein